MATALDIIRAALAEAEIYGIPEQIADADAAQGMESLNYIVDTWAEEYLYLYTLTALTLTLGNGLASYTIGLGSGANFALPRPTRIDVGPGRASVSIRGTPTPVDIVSAIEWEALYSGATGQATPNKLYYDPQYPLGMINVSPTPDASYILSVNSWIPFTKFATLTTVYNFAQGTEDALRHELSIVLKPFFSDTPANPVTIQKAGTAKASLKETNMLSRAMLAGTRA